MSKEYKQRLKEYQKQYCKAKNQHKNLSFLYGGYISETNAFLIPLCLKLSQINGCVRYFNDNKFMNLLVHDKELLKNTMQYVRIIIMY